MFFTSDTPVALQYTTRAFGRSLQHKFHILQQDYKPDAQTPLLCETLLLLLILISLINSLVGHSRSWIISTHVKIDVLQMSSDSASFKNKMLSYRRETALQGTLVFAKSEDWNWETTFYGHYRSILNHCDIMGQWSTVKPENHVF